MGLAQSVILGNWACPDDVTGINNQSLHLTRGRTGQLSCMDQALSQSLTKITGPSLVTRSYLLEDEFYTQGRWLKKNRQVSNYQNSSLAQRPRGIKQKIEMNYSFLNLNAIPLIHGVKLNFNNSKLAYFSENCAYIKHLLSFCCYHWMRGVLHWLHLWTPLYLELLHQQGRPLHLR